MRLIDSKKQNNRQDTIYTVQYSSIQNSLSTETAKKVSPDVHLLSPGLL